MRNLMKKWKIYGLLGVTVFMSGCAMKKGNDVVDNPSPTESMQEVTELVATDTPVALTGNPEASPTEVADVSPTEEITEPVESPSVTPEPNTPTPVPTPTEAQNPTPVPTKAPEKVPTKVPTKAPTATPTKVPTRVPTKAPTKAPTATPIPGQQRGKSYLSKEMFTLVNKARAEEGLRAYTWGKDLEEIAKRRAREFYEVTLTDEYKRGDYETCRRLAHQGGCTAGEILGMTPYHAYTQLMIDAWRDSPGHWHTIINPQTEDFVVGRDEDGNPVVVIGLDGKEYRTGDTIPGTPVRMAAAYYLDPVYGDAYWVLVTEHE